MFVGVLWKMFRVKFEVLLYVTQWINEFLRTSPKFHDFSMTFSLFMIFHDFSRPGKLILRIPWLSRFSMTRGNPDRVWDMYGGTITTCLLSQIAHPCSSNEPSNTRICINVKHIGFCIPHHHGVTLSSTNVSIQQAALLSMETLTTCLLCQTSLAPLTFR